MPSLSPRLSCQVQSPPSFLLELFSEALGTTLTAAHYPSSVPRLGIPAPSSALASGPTPLSGHSHHFCKIVANSRWGQTWEIFGLTPGTE